ncbi:hypothetical protein AAF712_009447 [Marasmius tenuissimus]|uniref:Uncharacterized protein n=1 Tax=Marasmius tenuissimus TaxID=585030 RepID=A0ABR2ZR47_9AGAR
MQNAQSIEKLSIEQPQEALVNVKHKSGTLAAFPASWHPYLELIRIEKPTGTKLMFWPFGECRSSTPT